MGQHPPSSRTRSLLILACAALACSTPQRAASQPAARTRTTPQLLVDLARDHGLNRRGRQTAADALHVTTLLRAALRVEPNLPDAHSWLYELSLLSGDNAAAHAALQALVRLQPNNRTAFARWLESGVSRGQTLEQRRAWLAGLLDKSRFSDPRRQAAIHLRLAELDLRHFDRDQARMHVDQAVALDPSARQLALLRAAMIDAGAAPHVKMAAALDLVRLNPLATQPIWQAARLMDELGFHVEAARFYQHALKLYADIGTGIEPPAAGLLELSHNATARERLDEALEWATKAVRRNPLLLPAQLHLLWLLDKTGDAGRAGELRAKLDAHFALLKTLDEWPVDDVAQAAWYYCTVNPQPLRALMLAEAAQKRASGDPFVSRVLGWAQALNQRDDQAVATLIPAAAAGDPYAAVKLAALFEQRGDADAAERTLKQINTPLTRGPLEELAAKLATKLPHVQPAHRRFPLVANLIANFNTGFFDFHERPGDFLTAAVTLDNTAAAPGDVWWATFSITNNGSFPVTLGADWMANPVFLLSFRIEGNRAQRYANLYTVSVDTTETVAPGETVAVRRALDVGPLRSASRRNPQQILRVTVEALFDAQLRPDGSWAPSPAGYQLKPVVFNRLPVRASESNLNALLADVRGPAAAARYRAIEILAQLLSESQRAARGEVGYRPDPIPTRRVRLMLAAALRAAHWETRVRALDAVQLIGFDRPTLDAATSSLSHGHWLVRLMAVRLLAERRGKSFAADAARLAADDPDTMVRDMAAAYLIQWNLSQPASQPASAPASRIRP